MNRLYVLENRYTLTGGISDHRLPLAASQMPVAAAVLAEEVGKLAGDAALQKASAALAGGADGRAARPGSFRPPRICLRTRASRSCLPARVTARRCRRWPWASTTPSARSGRRSTALKVDPGYKAAGSRRTQGGHGGRRQPVICWSGRHGSRPTTRRDFAEALEARTGGRRPQLTHLTDRPKSTTRLSRSGRCLRRIISKSWDDVALRGRLLFRGATDDPAAVRRRLGDRTPAGRCSVAKSLPARRRQRCAAAPRCCPLRPRTCRSRTGSRLRRR